MLYAEVVNVAHDIVRVDVAVVVIGVDMRIQEIILKERFGREVILKTRHKISSTAGDLS